MDVVVVTEVAALVADAAKPNIGRSSRAAFFLSVGKPEPLL